jgi:hypothetical protein
MDLFLRRLAARFRPCATALSRNGAVIIQEVCIGSAAVDSITSYSCQISAHSPKMVRLHDRRYTINMLDVGFECVDSKTWFTRN